VEKNSQFPEGPVIKSFVIPPDTEIEGKKCEKVFILLDASLNYTIAVFFFAAEKK